MARHWPASSIPLWPDGRSNDLRGPPGNARPVSCGPRVAQPARPRHHPARPLSWNEIRHNAIRFAQEWAGETREEAEAKALWDEFFQVFGTRRRLFVTFDEPVKHLGGDYNFIDLFWRGVLLGEHKSFGRSLAKAETQAMRYIQDLARTGREREIPRYIVVSDFARVALHDLEEGEPVTFPLAQFHQHIHALAFIRIVGGFSG